jgi:hypothetical protein
MNDPGVPNWLDPVGDSKGLICARVLRPLTAPAVRLRKVRTGDLRQHLHPQTAVMTPAERSRSLRSRMLATVRRFRE